MRFSIQLIFILLILNPSLVAQKNEAIALGFYKFQEGEKIGLKDSLGNIILPAQYNDIMGLDYSSTAKYKPLPYGIIKASVGTYIDNTQTHWKIFNAQGKALSDDSFTYVGVVSENLLKVGKGRMKDIGHNERYGVMNLEGTICIPVKYKRLDFYDYAGSPKVPLFMVMDNIKEMDYHIINLKNELASINIYQEIRGAGPRHLAKVEGKYGYIDNEGKTLIPFMYDQLNGFRKEQCMAIKNGLWGVINTKGETTIAFEYQDLRLIFEHLKYGTLYNAKKDGLWALINDAGTALLPHQYLSIEPFPFQVYMGVRPVMNQFLVKTTENKVGIIDIQSQAYIIPPDYNFLKKEMDEHKQMVLLSQKSDKFGIIDSSGQILTAFEYQSLHRLEGSSELLFRAQKGEYYGIIDGWTGQTVYPFVYSSIQRKDHYPLEFELTLVQKDSIIYTYIDGKGEATRIHKYPNHNFGHTQIVSIIDGRRQYAWRNFEGDTLTPFYDALHYFQSGWSLCVLGKKLGVLNRDGALILPILYDDIRIMYESKWQNTKNTYFTVKIDNKWGLVDGKNEWVVPARYKNAQDVWRNWKK